MKRGVIFTLLFVSPLFAQDSKEEESSNLRQYYSGKFGFYQPSDGLNNGLFLGVDGITEFVHYNFFLGGAIDLYPKQTFSFFKNPQPDVQQQTILLIPLHINLGYLLFNASKADTRGYAGAGLGYYLYFYNVEYRTTGGPLPSVTTQSESKTGGNIFATGFFRLLVGKVFVEPRFYLAVKREESIPGGFTYVVNPSGFAISIGFQY